MSEYLRAFTSPLIMDGKQWFNLRGSFSEVVDTLSTVYHSNNPVKTKIENHRGADSVRGWCGFGNQTIENFFQTRSIDRAIEDYKKAKAKIETPLVRGKSNYSPVGESFSMGKFLTGHPVCAFRREKTKLPAKTINLLINCSASLQPDALSTPLALIVKACTEYQAAGGLVTLTVNYAHQFSRPARVNGEDFIGWVTTIKIPLANPGILASAASVQFYRALSMPLAVYASPCAPDCLPVYTAKPAGYLALNGTPQTTRAVLEALAIA